MNALIFDIRGGREQEGIDFHALTYFTLFEGKEK